MLEHGKTRPHPRATYLGALKCVCMLRGLTFASRAWQVGIADEAGDERNELRAREVCAPRGLPRCLPALTPLFPERVC